MIGYFFGAYFKQINKLRPGVINTGCGFPLSVLFCPIGPSALQETAEQICLVWNLVMALWGQLADEKDSVEDEGLFFLPVRGNWTIQSVSHFTYTGIECGSLWLSGKKKNNKIKQRTKIRTNKE